MKQRFSIVPLLFVLLLMTPVYWLFIMSFKTNAEIYSGITLIPQAPTLNSYLFILTNPDWYMGFINALIYVCLNVVISIAVAVPAAFAFSRYRFFGDRILFFWLLAFRMTAPAILLIPFVQIFSELRLIDTHIAVALAHTFFNVPIAIWILEGFISSVPIEMDESAKVDGYSRLRYFTKILLPQIAPGISVTAFFCFMFSWVELLLANGLTTINAKPFGAIMTRYGGVNVADLPLFSAASVITLIPGIVVIFFVRKHLARGFSLGQVR